MAKIILFLHPIPLYVQLTVDYVKELETRNSQHYVLDTTFISEVHLYICISRPCHFSICSVPPDQLVFLISTIHSLLFRKNMNALHSIYKLDTPKQNHMTKKPFISVNLPILFSY